MLVEFSTQSSVEKYLQMLKRVVKMNELVDQYREIRWVRCVEVIQSL
jgi:hypothetical protein